MPHHTSLEGLRKKWSEMITKLILANPDIMLLNSQGYLADWWLRELTQREAEIIKAFGGCTKCYGKGYSTQMAQLIGAEDFGGDGFVEKPKVHINYCSCERGQVLSSLTSQG